MEDLECGIENPWPQEWWHALQQLKFLIDVRYHPMDPYYYIVHNKFVAEVRRCNMYERLMQPELNTTELPRTEQMTPWELEETEKEIKLKKEKEQEKTEQEQKELEQKELELKVKEDGNAKETSTQEKDQENTLQQAEQQEKALEQLREQEKVQENEQYKKQEQAKEQVHTKEQEQAKEQVQAKEQPQAKTQEIVAVETHQEPALTTPHDSASMEPVQNNSKLLEVYLAEADEPYFEPVEETATNVGQLPTLEAYQLTRLLRCYPATYGKADTATKRKAWLQVAKELNTSGECKVYASYPNSSNIPSLSLSLSTVTQCRLSLQHALREQRLLQLTDPNATCKLSANYYHHMTKIYQHVQAGGELEQKTPAQIRQHLDTISSPVTPENFIPDINFSTCSPSLVLKNWTFGACTMGIEQQRQLRPRLKEIFARYEKLAESNCPTGTAKSTTNTKK